MEVIYIDSLFLLNLVIDYVLTVMCAQVCGVRLRRWRYAFAVLAGAVYAVAVYLPALALTVAVAHLSLGSQSRRSQIDFIADILAGLPHAVLMGDFNCDPEQPEMQQLYRKTHLQPPDRCVPTFPSWRPQRAIDHMLVTPALALATMQALPAAQSDHLALSVELDVPETALR